MNAPIDISSVYLQTPRLVLRPFCEADLEDFYAYARVEGVGRMAGWKTHANIGETRAVLRMFIEGRITFAVVLNGRVVGSIGVEEYNQSVFPELDALSCRELGYVLAKDCWGQGLMPEAGRAVLGWLFGEKQLDAVVCCHFPENTQSARVQQKLGFRYVKTNDYTTRAGLRTQAVYNLLTREEFLRGNSPSQR